MNSNDVYQNEQMFQLFQEYRKFCWDRINDCKVDKEAQICLMTKIIDDLFNQNEHLITQMMEIKQSVSDRSIQIHKFLRETAIKTVDIGQALSSYELEMKKISQQHLPSIIDYDKLLKSLIGSYEKEKSRLKHQNQLLLEDSEKLKIELMQYKNAIHNQMPKLSNFSNFDNQLSETSPAPINQDLIESFIDDKLKEQEESVNSMICASLIDELICTLEIENETFLNKDDNDGKKCSTQSIDHWLGLTEDNVAYHDKDENEFIDNWCNILMDYKNNNLEHLASIPSYSKIDDSKFLTIFSTVLKEIKHKNSVINNMKQNIRSCRHSFRALYDRYIERGLQILEFLIEIIPLFPNNKDAIKVVEKMAKKIEKEIRSMIFGIEQNFPSLKNETNVDALDDQNAGHTTMLNDRQILLEPIS